MIFTGFWQGLLIVGGGILASLGLVAVGP